MAHRIEELAGGGKSRMPSAPLCEVGQQRSVRRVGMGAYVGGVPTPREQVLVPNVGGVSAPLWLAA